MRPYNQSKRPYSAVERLCLNGNWLLTGLFFFTIVGFLTLVHQYKLFQLVFQVENLMLDTNS